MRTLVALVMATVPVAAAERLIVLADGLKQPFGLDFLDGQVVVAEFGAHRIVQIDAAGKATVLAGSGKAGFADGAGEKAAFNAPHNVAVAPDGAIYVADTSNHRVRKLDPKTREVTTIAGGEKGYAGDGGPAKDARFDQAYHVALDHEGKALFVCDLGNRRVRRIDLKSGTIETVVGTGTRGAPPDGTAAKSAPLVDPRAVAVDKAGRLWILERAGHVLRVVEDGKVRTVAGTGQKGYDGDGGPAEKAKLDGPKFLWIDPAGDVLIADTENHCIRKYAVKDGKLTRVAGTAKKGMGEPGAAPAETDLTQPHGVAVGPDGVMYVADSSNGRVLRTAK